jgi:hypothetical protein
VCRYDMRGERKWGSCVGLHSTWADDEMRRESWSVRF